MCLLESFLRDFDQDSAGENKLSANQSVRILECPLIGENTVYYNIKRSLQLYLLQDEASPLIKEGHSKHMDIQGQTQSKTSITIIQFHLHISTNM